MRKTPEVDRDANEIALRDLDETRRLIYTATLADPSKDHAELAATLINALAHHSMLLSIDEAFDIVPQAVKGDEGARSALMEISRNVTARIMGEATSEALGRWMDFLNRGTTRRR